MFLSVTQPLDLAATLFSGQDFRWRHDDALGSHGVVKDHLVALRQVPGGLEAWSPGLGEKALTSLLRWHFRLDDDLERIHAGLSTDPVLARAVQRHRGLRLLRLEPWPALASFICSSHANISRIAQMVEALATALGRPLQSNALVRHTFPPPALVAEAGEARLRELGLGFRARSLAAAAAVVAGGQLSLEALAGVPLDEARRRLITLPGVGEKVADCVLLLAYEHLDAFPIDRWVRRAVEQWYRVPRGWRYEAVAAWAREHFGPYCGYAQLYIFQAARLGPGSFAKGAGDATV
ncbi:MAG: 8-oxoguanine DNA glycosylase [Chloroflexi bacterium]|nr:8-oxoguanine DNA glycosylase [Chloroflexota bacterium]